MKVNNRTATNRLAAFILAASLTIGVNAIAETLDSELRFTAESVDGIYIATLQPEKGTIPIGTVHRWIIGITSAENDPVYPARITVGGGMNEHGHGLPTQPQIIAYGGNGEYLVGGIRFSMEGSWKLSFIIESEHGADRVDFEIDVAY